jgi:hypothetical protein
MHYYRDYINSRLKSSKSSDLGIAVSDIVDKYSPKASFTFYFLTKNECYECWCDVKYEKENQKRFCIKSLQSFRHNLDAIYKDPNISKKDQAYVIKNQEVIFDGFYDKYDEFKELNQLLLDAVKSIAPSKENCEKFLAGSFTDIKAVRYALQTRLGGPLIKIDIPAKWNKNVRVMFSPSILAKRVHVSMDKMSVLDVIHQKSINVFVPTDSISLCSNFIDNISWKKILPKDCSKCRIGDIECLNVNISFEIDAFNNLYCVTYSADNEKKRSLLVENFGVLANIEEQADPPKQNDLTVRPINYSLKPENEKNNDNLVEVGNTDTETVSDFLLKEKTVSVKVGQKCDYSDIFGDYLIGAEEIQLEDAYIVHHYQFENLRDLISIINQMNSDNDCSNLRNVKLVTRQPIEDYIKDGTIKATKEDLTKNQERELKKLKSDLKKANIIFSSEFDPKLHDRRLILSNGWTIHLGLGLDMFNRQENEFIAKTCRKSTTITFSRTGSEELVKHHKRKSRK